MATSILSDIDTVVLAGGKGTRLRSVLADKPKLLAPSGDRPFIEVLLDSLERQGARRLTFSLGHLADQVVDYLESHPRPGMDIRHVIETEPLGTGGGAALAARAVGRAPQLVMNGDTFLDADLAAFAEAGIAHPPSEMALMAVKVPDAADFGSLRLRDDGCIDAFIEKGAQGPGLVSAGVYLFKEPLLAKLQALESGSLETDVFPSLEPGAIFCHPVDATFLDIGTPDRLAKMQDMGA